MDSETEDQKNKSTNKTYIGELQSGIVNLLIILCQSYVDAGYDIDQAKAKVTFWLENTIIPTLKINNKKENE